MAAIERIHRLGLLTLSGVALCAGIFAAGCGTPPETRKAPLAESQTGPPAAETAPKSPAATGDAPETVQRLTQLRFQEGLQRTREPLQLKVPAQDTHSPLNLPVSLRADDYTTFRVTMRVDKGTSGTLTWQSDIEPEADKNPGVFWPIFADNQPHTYTIPLESLDVNAPDTWAGHVTRLVFTPSDEPAHVTIESMELLYLPPKGPRRVTVVRETCEALMGTQAPWELTLPPFAVFETRLGAYPRSCEECGTDGFAFRIQLETPDGKRDTLFERSYDAAGVIGLYQRWTPVRVDLSACAGQKVKIHLEADNQTTSRGDYAFWGNPIVFNRAPEKESPPVILISCDTLRADHLSCYGYDRPTSVYIDQFAKEAVLFENAITQWGYTLPAHMTMLTGLYPKHHAVTTNGAILAEECVTLAEALRGQGYITGGFVATGWYMAPCFGFPQGFDVYSGGTPYRDVSSVHRDAARWLEEHPTDRFFLFLHNYDIHSKSAHGDDPLPYSPVKPQSFRFARSFDPSLMYRREKETQLRASDLLLAANTGKLAFSQTEVDYLVALYDDSIRVVDTAIGEFFNYLKMRRLYDRALIIVTADHGEEFGEHGKFMHTTSFEHTARVPLIVKLPYGKSAGLRVPDPVETADIYPTILNILQQPEQPQIDGRSLLPMLAGSAGSRAVAHTRHYHDQAVRQREWKLRRDTATGALSLFNLTRDPMEQIDCYKEELPVVAELKDELLRFFGAYEEGWHIAVRGGEKETQLDLEVTTDNQFASVEVMSGESPDDAVSMSTDPRVAGGTLVVTPSDTDEVVFRTDSPGSPVFLRISSPAPFDAAVGDAAPSTTKQLSVRLDPAASGQPPRKLRASSGRPSLYVWRVGPSSESEPSSQFPESAVEQLRALGYVD